MFKVCVVVKVIVKIHLNKYYALRPRIMINKDINKVCECVMFKKMNNFSLTGVSFTINSPAAAEP